MLSRLPLKRLTIRHKKLIAVFFTLLLVSLYWLTLKRSVLPRVSVANDTGAHELASASGFPETQTLRAAAATVRRKATPGKGTGPNFNEAYGKLPLQFEPNEGQAAPDVAFITRGSGYTLFLKQTEAVLSLNKQDVRLKLLDSNSAARISALDLLP